MHEHVHIETKKKNTYNKQFQTEKNKKIKKTNSKKYNILSYNNKINKKNNALK